MVDGYIRDSMEVQQVLGLDFVMVVASAVAAVVDEVAAEHAAAVAASARI